MHTSNKINILSIAESDFNNSLKELKEHLNFNLSFIKINEINELSNKYDVLLIHESILKDENTKKSLNKISSNKILISKSKDFKNFKFDERLNIPININELNKKAVELSARKEFSSNSSIEIKD